MSTDLHNMHEDVIPKSKRFTVEQIAKSQKYWEEMNPTIEYKRDFPAIVMENSSQEKKLEYAVKQVVLKSLEKEFTYKQLTEAIKKGDPRLYIDPNVIGRTIKKLGYVKKSRTRKGVRKYYYVFTPDTND